MFMPPDENNYKGHGKNNLVVKYEDQTSNTIDISPTIHLHSKFCRTYGIEEPLQNFVSKLNKYLLPLKQQQHIIDRNSVNFLVCGLSLALLVALIVGIIVNPYLALAVIASFLVILSIKFYLNAKKLKEIHKLFLISMALIVYLENQNVFVHYGIKAQMGHLGTWI